VKQSAGSLKNKKKTKTKPTLSKADEEEKDINNISN
jgi:hypothetical protein